ncbi:outer membrane protein assembly factor BamB family protein [Oceanibium sediminis]|uniref:outer membrane protein assembly factor BamB family protein n=1 Tax=Oceanibium sediminis TaxID=2026339 RepID=UPI000DD2DB94|nr:PQQ-binding-like beta-propeller repeat protein [Oceanibium sediminis]
MKFRHACLLLTLGFLAACAERELILPGEREDVRPPAEPALLANPDARAPGLRLPPSRLNAEWTHLNGSIGHLQTPVQLGADLSQAWVAEVGNGGGRRERMTSSPIIAGGVVYTLDAAATVTAVAQSSGQVLWRAELTPTGEQPTEGFGGGLAFDKGILAVTTGFGEILRLDPANGGIVWRTKLEGAVRAAPTLSDGRAVVVARGDLAYGIDLADGAIAWRLEGVGTGAGSLGGASPAVRGPVAIIPFVTGEVRAVLVRNGISVWSAYVTGGRSDLVRSTIRDISGDPVIDFDIVYVSNQAGQLVALDRRSGERLWTAGEGSYGPAVPVGGSVFVLSDAAELVRLDASSGAVIWRQPLQEWERPEKRRRAVPHFGPLLAGGRLVVASGDGLIRSFDPVDGRLLDAVELPAPAASHPAIASGTLFVQTRDGRLAAYR